MAQPTLSARIPVWATLIGLEVDGAVEVGVVSAPALGRRWWASAGRAPLRGYRASAVKVSRFLEWPAWPRPPSPWAACAISRPRSVTWSSAAKVSRDRGFGDFWSHVLVAEGACEAGLDPVVSVWDVAALQVIVEEAGGKFTDFSGQARLDGGSAVSSNGLVHDEVIAVLAGGSDQRS